MSLCVFVKAAEDRSKKSISQ